MAGTPVTITTAGFAGYDRHCNSGMRGLYCVLVALRGLSDPSPEWSLLGAQRTLLGFGPGRFVRFSNRPFGVKRFQAINHYLSDYPPLQCRCRSRARASLRNRRQGPSTMGFENEAEQSNGRPYRQIDDRSKRTNELTSSIVPRGTSFHRSVELGFSPIACDPVRFSCCCRGLFPGPAELGAVNPYAVHDHGQSARQGHDRLLHSAAPGDLHRPGLEPRPFIRTQHSLSCFVEHDPHHLISAA